MSFEMPESSEPILVSELSPELQRKALALFNEAENLLIINEDTDAMEATASHLHHHISAEVSAHPILARTVDNDGLESSLLGVVCKQGQPYRETVKFLIEVNPHALLYRNCGGYKSPIHLIAANGPSCSLLPWIVERYPWVLQHQVCHDNPPHLAMVESYADDRCGPETVRAFYELYPQGLREKGITRLGLPMYPLFASVGGGGDPDADLFIWMAQQYPEAVFDSPIAWYTFLHTVCGFLIKGRCTPNMANICRFLISEHPVLIRLNEGDDGCLPIHLLSRRCNRPLVQEIVVILLKAYPECVQMRPAIRYPRLSTVPFIQHMYPLIMKELEIDDEMVMLAQIAENIEKAAMRPQCDVTRALDNLTLKTSLLASISGVFCSWANLRISDFLSTRKIEIRERITKTCRRFEGDDVPGGFVVEENVGEEGELHWMQDYLSQSDDDIDSFLNAINGEEDWNGDSASELEDEEDGAVSYEIENEDDWEEERASQSEGEEDSDASPGIENEDDSHEDRTSTSEHEETDEDEDDPCEDRASQSEHEETADVSDRSDVEEDSFEDCAPRFENEDDHVPSDEDGVFEDLPSQHASEEDDGVPVEPEEEHGVYEDLVPQADNEGDDDIFDVKKEDDDIEDRAFEFDNQDDVDVSDEIEAEDSFDDAAADEHEIDEVDYAGDHDDYCDYDDHDAYDDCDDYDDYDDGYYSDGGYSYD